MKILGINAGSGASVCLLQDGRIVFALEEERPTRIKGKGGLPVQCFAFLAAHYGEFLTDLDWISVADLADAAPESEDLTQRYERRFLGETDTRSPLRRLASKIVPENFKRMLYPLPVEPKLIGRVQDSFPGHDLPAEKFVRLRHHDCHASAAYFGLAEEYEKPYLVLTLDGGGDGECASVSIGERGELRRIASTPSGNSVGNIYSNVTYLLGLKPHEHEYKIMGLEPYVPKKYRTETLELLRQYLQLDRNNGLTFERQTPENTNWIGRRMATDMKFKRFDSIAAGLQAFTEELVVQWVHNAIKHTGISDVLLSGGVFMNVKANKLISEMPEVHSVNVFPSCGDETNALGIAFHTYARMNGSQLPTFDSFTLGPSPAIDFEAAKEKYAQACSFEQLEAPNQKVAELLSQDNIVARCSGPCEVGARALGNRSLLADPTVPDVVERLNFLIKQRDFWMPFAPAVLAEDAEHYLKVPPSVPSSVSPHMMFAFDTTEARSDMAAALHRADKTARAQVVSKKLYPDFHEILSRFKTLTGRGTVLNTSFNRHGEPIVMGTADAIDVMLGTDLDYLVVEDWLITKR